MERIKKAAISVAMRVVNPILDSMFGKVDGFIPSDEFLYTTTKTMDHLNYELGLFIDEYQRTVMSNDQVSSRLILLDKLRVAQTLQEREQIVSDLRRACS